MVTRDERVRRGRGEGSAGRRGSREQGILARLESRLIAISSQTRPLTTGVGSSITSELRTIRELATRAFLGTRG